MTPFASPDPLCRCRVSRESLHARTRELALCAGRSASAVTQGDYEQAKRDLTGETDGDLQDARIS